MKSNLVNSLMIVLSLMSFQLQVNAGGGSQGPGKEGSVFLQIGHSKPTVKAVEKAGQTCREKILEMHAKSINEDLTKDAAVNGNGLYNYYYTRKPLNKENGFGACWMTDMSWNSIKDGNIFDSISGFSPENNPNFNIAYITIISYREEVSRISSKGCGKNEYGIKGHLRYSPETWYQLVTNTIPILIYNPVADWVIDPSTNQPTQKDDIADNLQILNGTGVGIAFYNEAAYDKLKITTPLFTYPRAEYVQCLQSELTKN